MGRKPDRALAELKEMLRIHLDAALDHPIGYVLHADLEGYVLRVAKQVKREQPRWDVLLLRPGEAPDEIYVMKKEPDLGPREA